MTTTGTACRHHWRLEEPNGHFAQGSCQACGAIKVFGNSEEAIDQLVLGRQKTYVEMRKNITRKRQQPHVGSST